jgi:hypothetical protein
VDHSNNILDRVEALIQRMRFDARLQSCKLAINLVEQLCSQSCPTGRVRFGLRANATTRSASCPTRCRPAARSIDTRMDQCPLFPGDLNRSTQHLLILLDKEVADGDVTDIVHGEAEG